MTNLGLPSSIRLESLTLPSICLRPLRTTETSVPCHRLRRPRTERTRKCSHVCCTKSVAFPRLLILIIALIIIIIIINIIITTITSDIMKIKINIIIIIRTIIVSIIRIGRLEEEEEEVEWSWEEA